MRVKLLRLSASFSSVVFKRFLDRGKLNLRLRDSSRVNSESTVPLTSSLGKGLVNRNVFSRKNWVYLEVTYLMDSR